MNFLSNVFRAYQKARTCSVLYGLSDQQLADIGIQRERIPAHVEKVFGD